MSMPFYVAPEQVMKDRADFARKNVARGRPLVGLSFADGIVLCAENPSSTLHKIGEIYDRIGFAGVGKYNEFDQLRKYGVRTADLTGYQYSREDVTANAIANNYAQILGNVFTHEMKPLEIEILVAEVGATPDQDELFHILYDGTVMDVDHFAVLGGEAEAIADRLSSGYDAGADLTGAVAAAVAALAGPGRTLGPADLEVAVLDRVAERRAFRRLDDAQVASLLPALSEEAAPADGATDAGAAEDAPAE